MIQPEEEFLGLLKVWSTKELLGLLNSARRCGGSYDPFYEGHGRGFTIDEIKAELATREHIPNKLESRKARQEKAKRRG